MPAQPEGFSWPQNGALGDDAEPSAGRPLSAYIHVPFCTVRCGYCDFNTYTKGFGRWADPEDYHLAVIEEIKQSARVLREAGMPSRPLQSIFFGGGTPSLLQSAQVQQILAALKQEIGVVPAAEITLEANPETITTGSMSRLAGAGITRVSMGMQSAVPRILRILDRQHDPANVGRAVRDARDAGLAQSVDLIYGAPTETLDEWRHSVEEALSLGTDHLSVYSLIVEPGTKMSAQIARGELPGTDGDLDAEKYLLADRLLADAGFRWYEISNFARTDAAKSVHNLAYWRDWDWWGYGPGAHSHVGKLRWWNVKHPSAYAGRLAAGRSPGAAGERLTTDQRVTEQTMLAIRTDEGLSLDGVPVPASVPSLVRQGLVDEFSFNNGRVVLTLAGRLLADAVTRQLLGWD